MIAPNSIPQVYKSIMRHTVEMIDHLNALNLWGTITYHDFESRGDENELPRTTLIGVDGFSFSENRGLWIVRFALAISSYRDTNLLNEIEMIGEIQNWFGEHKKINLLNMADGTISNEMVVTDFEMLPMAQSEIRNYRTIGIEIKRTGTDGEI
jgi:hypothetical protein